MKGRRFTKKDLTQIPLESIIDLIKIEPYRRTVQENKKLQTYFCSHAQYFSKLQHENQLDKVNKLISNLKIETFEKNTRIMNFGDYGDKFYSLLSGKVGINKPYPKEKEMTFKEYLEYLLKIRDVEKNIKKFNRVQDYNSKIDKYKLLMINYDPLQVTNCKKKIKVFIEEEREIVQLEQGCFFGEMALIKNEPRNATIIALENCITVTVDRIDYKKIMKELEEQRINSEMGEFKKKFPIFLCWSIGKCSKIKSGLLNENYYKDDYIFKQNDIPDYVYLLAEGEIEITCDINFENYGKFVEYIYDNSNTLYNEFDNNMAWKEDNLAKLTEDANQKNSLPFSIYLSKIEKYMLLHNSFLKRNVSECKNDYFEQMEKIQKENENVQKITHRINIAKLKAPQYFGFLEIIELKRRIYNVKCISKTAKIQKYPYLEYLSMLPRDERNQFHLEKTFNIEKKYLIEQLRNGVMAKFDFHGNSGRNKKILSNYYPDRNGDKIITIKPKILLKSISKFSMDKQNNNKNKSTENIFCIKEQENENDNDNINFKNSMIFNSKSNLILGFKKSLFNKEHKRNKSQVNIAYKNNYFLKNYSEDVLSTGKYIINSEIINQKMIPKILLRKKIRNYNALSSSRSNISNEVVSLPSIGNINVNNNLSKIVQMKSSSSSLSIICRDK